MKTATDIMFTRLSKEEISELTEPVQERPGNVLDRPKKFTASDLWHIHRHRKSFERRRHIISK